MTYHSSLKVVALSILNDIGNDEHGKEKDDSLESLKVESHWLVNNPSEDNKEWSDEESNLHGGANGYTHSKIHFILERNDNCSDVLGGISDNWDEDQANKGFGDVGGLDEGVDGVDEILGADGDSYGGEKEDDAGGPWRHLWLLGLRIVVRSLIFVGEQVGMSAQLEPQIHNIQYQQND